MNEDIVHAVIDYDKGPAYIVVNTSYTLKTDTP